MKKLCCLVLSIFIFCFGIGIKAEDLSLAQNAKSAILLEASTGEVIFEKNSHEKLHPASMTKMMSMLLILENIEKGVINWDDIVTVSANASGMGGSQILLETNSFFKLFHFEIICTTQTFQVLIPFTSYLHTEQFSYKYI